MLFRYLSFAWLKKLAIVWLTITGLATMIHSIEVMRTLSKSEHGSVMLALELIFLQVPTLMLLLWPLVVLLATLLTFTVLAQRSELVALRSAGIGARRFLLGPMVVCVLLAGLLYGVGQPVAASLLQRYDRTMDQLFPGSASSLITSDGQFWLRENTDVNGAYRLVSADEVDALTGELKNVLIIDFTAESLLLQRTSAEVAKLNATSWQLVNGQAYSPASGISSFAEYKLATNLQNDVLAQTFRPAEAMPWNRLAEQIQQLRKAGFSTISYELQLQQYLAAPFLALALFLLAAPFALHFARSQSISLLLGLGVISGFGFYLLNRIVGALALAGQLEAVLAAWLPTFIALLLATALFLQLREE